MSIAIISVTLNKNTVKTGEQFTISVSAKESVEEPSMYRLIFRLGTKKGGIK